MAFYLAGVVLFPTGGKEKGSHDRRGMNLVGKVQSNYKGQWMVGAMEGGSLGSRLGLYIVLSDHAGVHQKSPSYWQSAIDVGSPPYYQKGLGKQSI